MRFVFLCLLVVAVLTGCSKKPDAVETARTFFEQVAAGKADEAYASTSLNFQAQQTLEFFRQSSKEMGLGEYVSMTSDAPELERNSAKLHVVVKTKAGGNFPLIVTLVNERKAWRLLSIRTPRSVQTGLSANLYGVVGRGTGFNDTLNHPQPTEEEVRKLVENALLMFNDAVQQGTFDDFYDKVSREWQKQLTKGQLSRAFQAFVDKKVNIDPIKGQKAVFDDPPAMTTDGLLVVKGYYPTQPRLVFSLKFMYELPKWKIFGLDISLVAAPPQ